MTCNTIINYNILDNVIANDDNFSWRDLNCVYRPWVTTFKAFGNEYNEALLLLSSFFSIYTKRKHERELVNFPKMYKEYLEEYFGIEIEKVDYDSKYEMISIIKQAIDKKCPVVLPVDLIELSYNPMYKKEHRFKYMIIKGYDLERELFHILDNIHLDYGSSTILTDFTSVFQEMYSMNKSYYECFKKEEGCNKKHLYIANKKEDKKIRNYTTLKFLNNQLKLIEDGKLEIVHFEEYLANIEIDEECKSDMEEVCKSLNLKPVFYETLFSMLSKLSVKDEEINNLKESIDNVNKRLENIKTEIIYKKVRKEKTDELSEKILQIKKDENEFRKELIKFIDNIEDKEEFHGDLIPGLRVLNSKNALIYKRDKDIIVKHSNSTTYDTWLMQDYAVQCLLDNVEEAQFIETKVEVNENIGDDIHSGIIVKFASGKRYLFGNYRGERVALFCPNLGDNFELYNRLDFDYESREIEKSNNYFKVELKDSILNFYCLDKNTLGVKCIYSLVVEEKIESMGLFSKTWEKLNHEVRFYDISYSNL